MLTGDEKADVQLAADNAKQALQGLAEALEEFLRTWTLQSTHKQARAALEKARPFLEEK